MARITLPERKQREHTEIVFGVPLTSARTVLTLAFQVLLLLLWEWLTLMPKDTPFPQTSHFAIKKHLHFMTVTIMISDIAVFCKCFFSVFKNLATLYKNSPSK